MKLNVSPWHKKDIRPINVGRYELYSFDKVTQFSDWDGHQWSIPDCYILMWRGIVRPCKKCGTPMEAGKAIAQTYIGVADFSGDAHPVTVSAGGSGKLVDCIKCLNCGWSISGEI